MLVRMQVAWPLSGGGLVCEFGVILKRFYMLVIQAAWLFLWLCDLFFVWRNIVFCNLILKFLG